MALENILSQEIVQKLGWTLLHFIWQAAAVALLLGILLAVLRKSSANLRYIVACAALGLIVLLPIVTIQLVPVSTPQPIIAGIEPTPAPVILPVQEIRVIPAVEMTIPEAPVQHEITGTVYKASWKQRATDLLEPALPYIVAGWLLGVFGLSLWHLGGWAQLQRLRKKMVRRVDESVHSRLLQLSEKLHIKRAVQILESALVQVPTVVGWLRPVILLPASALTGLSSEQLEALLAHELAHIRRHDYLINMLQTIVETLGFYHPAVWWVSHKIRIERENCCDDLAVSISGDRIRYAKALTSMEEIRGRRNELAVAASGGNLFGRIRRLVGKDSTESSRTSWVPSVITILLIAIIAIPTTLALTIKSESQESQQETEEIDPNSWQEKFYSLYRLEDGQVLKRIAPPFIPERRGFFLSVQPGRYSSNTYEELVSQRFNWDGDLSIRGARVGSGIYIPRLKYALEYVIGLGNRKYDIPPDILSADMSGDWIVRKDTPQEELLQALEQIIKDETSRDIDFVKQNIETKVIIAKGKYNFQLLPNITDGQYVLISTNNTDTYTGGGGGSGTLGKFLHWVGNLAGMNIIDQTEAEGVKLSWRNHDSSDLKSLNHDAEQYNQRLNLLLNNLSRQTGLTFSRETAIVEKWFISENGTIKAPQKTDAPVESDEGRIEGRIIDINTGKGIAAVQLAAVSNSSPELSERFTCTSTEDGTFAIGGLQSGEYLLRGYFPSVDVDVVSGRSTNDVLIGVDRRTAVPASKETTAEQQGDVQIIIDMRVIEMPADAMKDVFEPNESLSRGLLVRHGHEITGRLLTLTQERKEAKLMAAPQVIMLNNQDATIAFIKEEFFIIHYEPIEGEPGKFAPQLQPLEVGWKFKIHAKILESGEKVHIELATRQQESGFETRQYRPGYDYQIPSPPDIFVIDTIVKNGEPFIIGRIRDGETTYCLIVTPSVILPEPLPKPLLGKKLPEPDNIQNIDSLKQAEGKPTLICFWDMQQRPSRNLVGELAKREKELAEKNVAVLLVHTSGIESAKLKEWLDNRKIPFICGSIENDTDDVLFRWGVRAQPWLILTDKKGIVEAEGFGLEQLDEKLQVEESAINNSSVPVLAKSAPPSDVDKSIVKVDLSVVEVFSDSKMDRETTVLIENLLGGKIALSGSPAVADLLKKAAGATAEVKDESAGDKRLTQEQFDKLFDMLVSRGFVKILMNPTLEVVDGQTAKITGTQDSIQITPHVSKDSNIILLQIEAALSSQTIPEDDEQTPIVNRHEIATLIRLSAGETGIISGMKQAGLLTEPGKAPKGLEVPAAETLVILTPTIVGTVRVPQNEIDEPTEIPQEQKITISGLCRDPSGRPLSNAQVLFFNLDYQQGSLKQVAQSETDSEGRFTLGPITRPNEEDWDRTSYFIFVPADGHGPAWKTVNHYKPNNEPLELTAYNSAVVSGSILTEDSEPVAGAQVWVLGIISPEATEDPASRANDLHTTAALPGWSATTKQDGSFSIAGVPDGARIQLIISHRDFARTIVHVKPGFDVRIEVQPAAAITGRVLYGKSGKPAAGVIVQAQGVESVPIQGGNNSSWAQTTTDKQGRYRLESLFGTKYNIWAKAENLTVVALDSFQARVGETREAPDLLLIEGGFITGRVIDEATGKPVRPGQYSTVGIYGPSSPESFIAVEWSRIREDGSFRIRVAPGRNDIYLNPTEDWGSEKAVLIPSSQWVDVDGGQTEEVEFKIRKLSKEEMEAAAQYRQTKPIRMPIPVTIDEWGQSAHRMKMLGLELALYAQYDSPLPKTLLAVKPFVRDEQDFKWMLDNVEYFGQGKTTGQPNAAQTPIAYDRTMLEEGIETNVMFLDFSVRMLDRKGFNELGVSKMMNAEEHGDKLPDTQIARDGSVPVAAKDTNILPNDGRVEFVKPERLKDRGISKDQIMIDTKILTVSDEFMKYIGLDPNSVASSKGWSNYLVHSTDDSASFVIDQLHADLILKALAARMRTDEEIQMLHKPQVLAQSGKKIEITVLKSHYYMLSSPNEPNALSVEPESKFNRIDLGTTIRLTPNLPPDGKNVELDFEWEYRRLRGVKEHTGPDGNVQKVPQIDVDSIKTPCTIPDGNTLLIAGKKITGQKKTEPKKPRLSDLPLIGGLFNSPPQVEETGNLLILIKPNINPSKKAPPKQQPIDPNDPLIKQLEEKFKRSDEQK